MHSHQLLQFCHEPHVCVFPKGSSLLSQISKYESLGKQTEIYIPCIYGKEPENMAFNIHDLS